METCGVWLFLLPIYGVKEEVGAGYVSIVDFRMSHSCSRVLPS
jgi:hypothetical protein